LSGIYNGLKFTNVAAGSRMSTMRETFSWCIPKKTHGEVEV